MNSLPQIGKIAPNFLTVGIYKNKLGKIRLSDYHGKKYILLVFFLSSKLYIYLANRINSTK